MEKLLKAIAKLAKGIANSSIEQQVSLLPQALEYGDSGINFLIDRLSDSELEIRAKAYNLLQDVESEKAQRAIALGLMLNPGDKVYSVYQSGTSFNDDGYSINDHVAYLEELDVLVYGEEYFHFHEEEEFCKSKRLFCYLNQQEAEEKAEALHRELIQKKKLVVLVLNGNKKIQVLSSGVSKIILITMKIIGRVKAMY